MFDEKSHELIIVSNNYIKNFHICNKSDKRKKIALESYAVRHGYRKNATVSAFNKKAIKMGIEPVFVMFEEDLDEYEDVNVQRRKSRLKIQQEVLDSLQNGNLPPPPETTDELVLLMEMFGYDPVYIASLISKECNN
jgi:hypothetical protein